MLTSNLAKLKRNCENFYSMSLPAYISTPLKTALLAAERQNLDLLRGGRILITGATGFFGGWILSALAHLNDELGLRVRAICLSRNPSAFLARRPDLAKRSEFEWLAMGPAGWNEYLEPGSITHILHMAASADARDYAQRPLESFFAILEGSRFAIEAASASQAHLHFVSSGAVYGARRLSDGPCFEHQITRFAPDPLDLSQPYANAKRAAEALIACSEVEWSISRPFAFLGPHLPLDWHFAAGNFIRDALRGIPITLTGDGSPIRSYMHPADLAMWTLALCAMARPRLAVNVGSDQPVALKELALRVSTLAGSPSPTFASSSPAADPSAYWPSTELARSLGLRLSLNLDACVNDAMEWGALA